MCGWCRSLFPVAAEVKTCIMLPQASAPAVELLRMLLPHGVKPVSNRGVLPEKSKMSKPRCNQNHTSSCATHCWETHHSDGEVVVDDFIRHGVSLLLILIGDDLHAPAVHRHRGASLDLLQDATQIFAVVSWKMTDFLLSHKSYAIDFGKSTQTFVKHFCYFGVVAKNWDCHLRPSADIAPGRFLCPEEAQPQGAAPQAWLCLNARKGKEMSGAPAWISHAPALASSPIASRIQPTVPSPPHTRILYSWRSLKKLSLK